MDSARRPFFNSAPLALLSVAFAVGVLLSRVVAVSLGVWIVGGVLFSCLAVVSTLTRRADRRGTGWLILAAFVCAGAALGMLEGASVGAGRVQRFYEDGRVDSGEPVELTGALERAPEWSPEGFRLTLSVESLSFKNVEQEASGRVELFAPIGGAGAADGRGQSELRAEYEALELRRGARVRVLVALGRRESFRNPGVASFAEYLERRELDATGMIKSPLLVERLEDDRVLLPLVWLDELRARLLTRINELFTPQTAGVLNAAMLGNREGLSRATGERFRAGGTFHVLVISGLHITFIGGVVLLLARRATKRRAWQFGASVALVWAFAVTVGAEASVVRAALMFTAVALAPVLHRRATSINALGGAALALLAWRPANLFDPSFQLTFVSVLLIVALAWPLLSSLQAVGAWRPTRAAPHPPVCARPWRWLGEALFWRETEWRREMRQATYSYRLFKTPLAARLERWRVQALLRHAFAAVLVSACVQVGMLPLLVVYFHRFSFAALALNVFVGACMAALALLSLCALVVAQFSQVAATPLVWLVEQTAWLMEHGVDPFTTAGIASMRLPEYAGRASLVYALYYAPLAVLSFALARWRPLPDALDLRRTGREAATPHAPQRPQLRDADLTTTTKLAARPAAMLKALRNQRLRPKLAKMKVSASRRAVGFSALSLVALFVIILSHPLSAGRTDGRLRVDFLDVGQGDSALVTMPDGATLLIDGGGRPRFDAAAAEAAAEGDAGRDFFERDARGVGEAVVSEYLWWRGLERVDYVLATHADADHIGGLSDVVNNFRVLAALVARTPAGEPEFQRFAQTTKARGVPLYLVGRGDTLVFGAASAQVLWPPRVEQDANMTEPSRSAVVQSSNAAGQISGEVEQNSGAAGGNAGALSRNNDSVVLRLRFGQRVFLLTGDIEKESEAALVAADACGELRVDVVKVAHHGSRTSSTPAFIDATRPTLAVVSVGLDSPFGHPHREVVERWRKSGAEVLTTGQRGMISVSTDGTDLRVETYR